MIAMIPERRLPATFNVLAFLSVTLPILAGISAFAAWRISDRMNRIRPVPHDAPGAVQTNDVEKKQLEDKQRETENALHEAERALERSKQELAEAERAAKAAVAHATDRKITPSQRKKFIEAAASRPKGKVSMTVILGDEECASYADQIRELLMDAGFEVSRDLSAIDLKGGSLVGVRVGAFSKETAPPHALPLAASFIDSDIPAYPVINRRVAAGGVDVTVGQNPLTAIDDLPDLNAATGNGGDALSASGAIGASVPKLVESTPSKTRSGSAEAESASIGDAPKKKKAASTATPKPKPAETPASSPKPKASPARKAPAASPKIEG